MKIRIGGQLVDVAERACVDRECLWIGMDHGPYVQGRGYTDSAYKSRPVCMQRHLHGCPTNSRCPACGLLSVDEPGTRCKRHDCDGRTEEYTP